MNYLNLWNYNFWKLYHVISFCWRGFAEHKGRALWKGDKSPLTKWRETSAGAWFSQSKELWKSFPETLKQKMCPGFSCWLRGVGRRSWPYSQGELCCSWCPLQGRPPVFSWGAKPHQGGGTGGVSKQPQTSSQRGGKPCGPNTYRTVPSCTVQGVLLGSVEELIKGQTSF